MHSKFKINILPVKDATLPSIRSMLEQDGIQPSKYQLKKLERGTGLYALVPELSVTRQILASLEARLAQTEGYYYLVDSPRLSTVVVKGVYLRSKEGEPISMSSIVESIANTLATTSTSGVVAASRLRNKRNEPTNALKVIFMGATPTKPGQLGLKGRKVTIEPFIPKPQKCRKCHGFHFTSKCKSEQTKCPKCSGSHESSACTAVTRKCPNCGGSHSANWQGCPSYKTQKAANYVKATEGISYAAALTKVKVLADTIKTQPQPLQPATKQTQEGDPKDPYVPLSQVLGLFTNFVPTFVRSALERVMPDRKDEINQIMLEMTSSMNQQVFPVGRPRQNPNYYKFDPSDWPELPCGSAKAPGQKPVAKAKPQDHNSDPAPRAGVMTSLPKSGGQGDTSKTTKSKKSPPKPTQTRAKTKGQTPKERHTPTEQPKSSASRKLELSNNSSQTAVKDSTQSRDADETMPKSIPETPRRSRKRAISESRLDSPDRRRKLSSNDGQGTFLTPTSASTTNLRVSGRQTKC